MIGEERQFSNGEYRLIENNIIPKKDKSKFIVKLNVYAILLMVIGLVINHMVFMNREIELLIKPLTGILVMLSFLVYIVVHEMLHGLAFSVFNGNSIKELKFGFVLKSGMAYCISTVPVKVRPARLSLMMPVYVVCIPMYITAVVLGSYWLGLITIFFLSGSIGDFYYIWKLRGTDKELYMFEEMPTSTGYEVGYLLYEKLN